MDAQNEGGCAARVMTVAGPIAPQSLGVTLPHEHILVDFIGADKVTRDRYDPDEVFDVALPHLERLRGLGCATLVECTPAYLGRDAELLARLAHASGLQLITNTGYYGAAADKFVPAHAYTETAEQLARRWTREFRDGIEGTTIRPGFIKTGVDPGPLSEIDKKLIIAAAKTHLATGLTIAAHTGNGIAAREELSVLAEQGVDGSAFIWVHAQNEGDTDVYTRMAETGAWIEFDAVHPNTVQLHVEAIKEMAGRGLLDHVLLSQDAGWYHVGEPGGGNFRAYDTLFTELVPALEKADFTDDDIRWLTVDNPRKAFTIRVRGKTGI